MNSDGAFAASGAPKMLPSPEFHYGEDSKGQDEKISSPEISHTSQHVEHDDDLKKDHMDYNRVDEEVAKYASVCIHIASTLNSLSSSRISIIVGAVTDRY
jgi:hypothetical protein